jgi:two-component system sensor histidine kinase TctE
VSLGRHAIPTLRQRLLRGLLVPLVALAVLGIMADYFQARQLAEDSYDQVLASTAIGLASRLELERDGDLKDHLPPTPPSLEPVKGTDPLLYAVFDAQGRTVAGLATLKSIARVHPQVTQPYFHTEVLSGVTLRVATYAYAGPEGHGTIVVAESPRKRQRAAQLIMKSTVWINLLTVVFTLTVVYFAVRYALRPLDKLSQQMQQRQAQDLSPLALDQVLGEVRPLVAAANQLMGRLRDAALSQQAFLSNTAHQLRTPLAGLQTQLELVCDGLPPEARPRVTHLLDSVQRLGHLTHQMLALARAAPDAQVVKDTQPVDLCLLLEEVASSSLDRALARQIDLGFEPSRAQVMGSHWMLRELLANLVDNAIAYTPVGGRVTVSCGMSDDGVAPCLTVDDSGIGIAPAERAKVFERFYRAQGTATTGTGLGLTIVQEIADRHGARIEVGDGPGGQGTSVRVVFLPAPLVGSDIP